MGCLRCMSRVKSFHVKILLLDKQELIQEVTETTTGQDLLDNIFKYLNLIETAYFGLRYQDNENQTVSRHMNQPTPYPIYILIFLALVGSKEESMSTSPWTGTHHSIFGCEILCCRSLSISRRNYSLPIFPASQARRLAGEASCHSRFGC